MPINNESIEMILDDIHELEREEGSLDWYDDWDQERRRQIHRELKLKIKDLQICLH